MAAPAITQASKSSAIQARQTDEAQAPATAGPSKSRASCHKQQLQQQDPCKGLNNEGVVQQAYNLKRPELRPPHTERSGRFQAMLWASSSSLSPANLDQSMSEGGLQD